MIARGRSGDGMPTGIRNRTVTWETNKKKHKKARVSLLLFKYS